MLSWDFKYKRITFLSLAFLFLTGMPSNASDQKLCDAALSAQSSKSGLPSSLAQALASNLAIGPGGKMYPYSVQADGRIYVEKSANEALKLVRDLKNEGTNEIRVGCLGLSVNKGHDDKYIWNTLNPNWNVATAMSGISSNVKTDIGAPVSRRSKKSPESPSNISSDIGAPLAAIMNNSAPPVLSDPHSPLPDGLSFAESGPPPEENIIIDKNVGNERSTSAIGGVKSTWGLFNNTKPSPLTAGP